VKLPRAAVVEGALLQAAWRRPRFVLLLAGALTAASLLALPAARFDYSRLNLQARGTESVIWERRIMESRRSGFAALATAGSLEDLAAKEAAFTALPAVSEVVSVLKVVPGDQEAKIAAMRALAPLVAGIRFGNDPAVDPAPLAAALETLRHRLEIVAAEAEGASAATLRSAYGRARELLARVEAADGASLAGLARVQATLRDDFAEKLDQLRDNLAPRPVAVGDLPSELTRKFVGGSGRLLMFIYPSIDTWHRDGARAFVRQLRSVDPAVTGSPVIGYEASRLMEAAYFNGTLYAGLLVALVAAWMLRRPRDIGLALVPMALGTLWTVGVMWAIDLPFNLANVWGLPLLIGASAEYGFNVVLRYRERARAAGVGFPRSGMLATTLNGLTTIAGFGSLMIAQHQGIFGLGLLLTIGTAAALVSSLVLVPVLLHLVDRRKPA
jgi:hypothetical protein